MTNGEIRAWRRLSSIMDHYYGTPRPGPLYFQVFVVPVGRRLVSNVVATWHDDDEDEPDQLARVDE